jgi:hypothetical protein
MSIKPCYRKALAGMSFQAELAAARNGDMLVAIAGTVPRSALRALPQGFCAGQGSTCQKTGSPVFISPLVSWGLCFFGKIRIMRNLTAVLAVMVLLAGTVPAAAQCYNERQFEAEQGLRIHSELMVISLTCMKMPEGPDMYLKYQEFTKKNKALISSYEADMIGYFRDNGYAAPEKQFHTLRTNLANQISQHAIKMSTASFCQHFGTRIDRALGMDQENLRQWAAQPWPNSPTTHPACGQLVQR